MKFQENSPGGFSPDSPVFAPDGELFAFLMMSVILSVDLHFSSSHLLRWKGKYFEVFLLWVI